MINETRFRSQIQIDQFAQKLLDISFVPQPDLNTIEKLISEVTSNPNSSDLSVFLASELLWQLPNLELDVVKKIEVIKTRFIKKDPVFTDLNMRKWALVDALDQFCQQDKVQISYFQLESNNNLKVKQILKFICQQNATHYKSNYSNDQKWIFEPYLHPKKQIPGVWMSQNGQHFTNEALLKLERAKDATFRQTYLIPAAQSTVGKKIPVQ